MVVPAKADMERAKRTIVASQKTRRFVRLAQILHCGKERLFRMTNSSGGALAV